MKVDKLKSRLATSTIRNEPISNEEILQAENELLHEIYPSQIEIGQILREAREDLKNSLEDAAKSLRIKKEYLISRFFSLKCLILAPNPRATLANL